MDGGPSSVTRCQIPAPGASGSTDFELKTKLMADIWFCCWAKHGEVPDIELLKQFGHQSLEGSVSLILVS